MSVNAVNGVEPQKKQHSVGTAVATAIPVGLAGAGIGYQWGGGKYIPTWEALMAQSKDEFDSSMNKAKNAEKDAAKIAQVQGAYDGIRRDLAAKETELNNARKGVNDFLYATTGTGTEAKLKVDGYTVPEKFAENVKGYTTVAADAEEGAKAKVITSGSEVTKVKIGAGEAETKAISEIVEFNADGTVKSVKDPELLKKAIKQEGDSEVGKLLKLIDKDRDARMAKFDSMKTVADSEAKTLSETLSKVEGEFATEVKTKAAAISDDIKKTAFNDIKSALKEIKWGKIGLWGGIAAAVGLILGYVFSSKPAAPQEAQA